MIKAQPVLAQGTQAWTTTQASERYRLPSWGEGYFLVNEAGHITVSPLRDGTGLIDLYEVVAHLKEQDVSFPLLIRFQDVLHGRVQQLHEAFAEAISEYNYANRYQGVFPIKVNQLHEVVEEVMEAGKPYGLGIECGSKAELVAALALVEPGTLLLCNGYKDRTMLRLILDAQQLGQHIIPILEKHDEFEAFMRLAQQRKMQPQLGIRVRLSAAGAGRWADSGGDNSKFGISIPELLMVVDEVAFRNRRKEFLLY